MFVKGVRILIRCVSYYQVSRKTEESEGSYEHATMEEVSGGSGLSMTKSPVSKEQRSENKLNVIRTGADKQAMTYRLR